MKSSPPSSRPHRPTVYWSQILSLLAFIGVVAAGGGLGLVWLRQQITDTAERMQALQRERVQVERRLEYLGARIAELQRPDVLRDRALAMGLVLQRPQVRQVVRLGPLPAPLETHDEGPSPRRGAEPYRQTFDLAVMEPVRPVGR